MGHRGMHRYFMEKSHITLAIKSYKKSFCSAKHFTIACDHITISFILVLHYFIPHTVFLRFLYFPRTYVFCVYIYSRISQIIPPPNSTTPRNLNCISLYNKDVIAKEDLFNPFVRCTYKLLMIVIWHAFTSYSISFVTAKQNRIIGLLQ